MDSVFVKVEKVPESLSDKEMVVTRLDFLNEVKKCKTKKPASDILALNYIRGLAEEIGTRYDNSFNVYRNTIPSDYVGIRCNTEQDVADVIEKLFMSSYPQILDKYVEHSLRKRPISNRVVYAVGDLGSYEAFKKLGIPEITEKELDAHLGDAKLKTESSDSLMMSDSSEKDTTDKEDESNALKKLFKLKK